MNSTKQSQAVEREAAVPGGEEPALAHANDETVGPAFRALGIICDRWAEETDLARSVDSLFLAVSGVGNTTMPGAKERARELIERTIRHTFEEAFYRGRLSARDNPPAHRPPQPGVVTEELREALGVFSSIARVADFYVEEAVPQEIEFPAWGTPLDSDGPARVTLTLADIRRLAKLHARLAAPSPGASVTASADGDVIEALRAAKRLRGSLRRENGRYKPLTPISDYYESLGDLFAALSRLEASQPASSGSEVAAAQSGDQRLWWFLTILDKSSGQASADDCRWNWINAFCDDRGNDTDTFNLARDQNLTRVTHDSDTDSGNVYLTDAGRAWLAVHAHRSPAAETDEQFRKSFEIMRSENASLLRENTRLLAETAPDAGLVEEIYDHIKAKWDGFKEGYRAADAGLRGALEQAVAVADASGEVTVKFDVEDIRAALSRAGERP
jgi:hypothetical protein